MGLESLRFDLTTWMPDWGNVKHVRILHSLPLSNFGWICGYTGDRILVPALSDGYAILFFTYPRVIIYPALAVYVDNGYSSTSLVNGRVILFKLDSTCVNDSHNNLFLISAFEVVHTTISKNIIAKSTIWFWT
jgi:hypothetical protein